MTSPRLESCLLVRIGPQLCALPLPHVEETLRPQPATPIAGAPSFVSGVAVIRGRAVPVLAAGEVLGVASASPARLVTLKVAGRLVALAVDDVVGVRSLPAGGALPPLLATAARETVSAVGTLDAELLMVLDTARLVPPDVWRTIEAGGAA